MSSLCTSSPYATTPIAVVIWVMEQCFWMLGGRWRRRQAFGSNDGRWNLREGDDESTFFFLPSLLILYFSVSLRRLSRSVWIIDTELFELDFISQFPQQLKGKGGDHRLPPQTPITHQHTHPPPPFFFSPSSVSVQTLSQFGGCGSSANFCTGALNVSWYPLWRERERGWW